ncbi:MAG: phosphoribosylformylglycinamidine synthase [Candidatus Eisenbacteria bacterium]|nr:phosphoribosylformylglycinamidine synthase [Candidatus Eisenbacteria bacterium]
MPARLEIALRPELFDAEGASIARKARDYFGYEIDEIRTVRVITMDARLSAGERQRLRADLFTNPVTEESSYQPLDLPADWVIWVGLLPGVKDAAGETAAEAIEDLLGRPLASGEACYTSKLYFVREGGSGLSGAEEERRLTRNDLARVARELLANDLIQRWQVWRVVPSATAREAESEAGIWDPSEGIGYVIPRVTLEHTPRVTEIPVGSDAEMLRVSAERDLFLDPRDVPAIRRYFSRRRVREARRRVGLDRPTDVELEYIAQARSDHCNHNTFRGRFDYVDRASGERLEIDSLFHTFIEEPTLEIARRKPWVISVLWDNAGVGRFDERHFYTITGETHNSPSNMEAYGGSITGIVGVYRDPLGTGKGSKLVLGTYGYCVGPRDYAGALRPRLHPRRLLDGVIEGVRDGGNKSGIPTPFGLVFQDESYLGKCLVYVTAVGIMPSEVAGGRSDRKRTSPGELVVMCGGRVGKDGIHGVTASSHIYSERIPAGHVQIGDPYTQKKMHDFLLVARDRGLIRFITDCGGGGLSSAVGESARFAGGVEVELDRIPLKYDGLDQWEIWISESQERMVVSVAPEQIQAFLALAAEHAVEATVIGRYTDSGYVHLTYEGQTCAYVSLDFFQSDFPQWRFAAEWVPPAARGLAEPVLSEPRDHAACLLAMLARPNIASKEWIARQYDHEVQGGSVVKPLAGARRDVPSDAAVVRPVLESTRGLAITQTLHPTYSRIDAYHMTAVTIDEAVRRLIAVGADPEHIGGVDNFCWPEITYHPERNPDGKLKAAQLVRSCLAMKRSCLAMGIPLLSGKDSMYIDGALAGAFGEQHRVSGLPTLQFTAISVVTDVTRCVTLDPKVAGHLLYILGVTRDELGGSEYYEMLGETGLHVPQADPRQLLPMYRALAAASEEGHVASAHAIGRGGLGVHLALLAMAGDLGLEVELWRAPCAAPPASRATATEAAGLREDRLLYAESAGRLLVTVPTERSSAFEARLTGHPLAALGVVCRDPRLVVRGRRGAPLLDLPISALRDAWQQRYGELI